VTVPTVERGFFDVVFCSMSRRRQPVDLIDIGLLHISELARISRQALT
jgi:hypothetical protein